MEINYLGIGLATVASMVIGALWYGPLFGKMFIGAMEMDKWSKEKQAAAQKGMMMAYFLQFLASIVMFYVLSFFMNGMGDISVRGGMMTGFWLWLGMAVPLHLGNAIWGGKSLLFWLGIGNTLVTLLAAGAILGYFG